VTYHRAYLDNPRLVSTRARFGVPLARGHRKWLDPRDSGSRPAGLRCEAAQGEARQSGDSFAGSSPNPANPSSGDSA
jgi:hypothetical protein